MLARVLFITDLHKRYKDMVSIKGNVQVQHKIQKDIVEFNVANHVTHNVIAGDWYDRGFHGIGQAYSAMEEDRMISKSVNGNVYLCLGNHFYLERDDNPEMYIIQPCNHVKPKDILQCAEKPIFNVVPSLRIGSVQISFFHFSKLNKAYRCPREEGVTFHIGVYHDDVCVPAWVREREGFGGMSSVYELNQLYSNIDLAVHGHIHTDIGYVPLELNSGRVVPLYIPGSLGISQNKDSIKHKEVKLPMIDINEDGTVTVHVVSFSTHIDELRFYNVDSKKPKKKLITDRSVKLNTTGDMPSNLPSYLQSVGYSDQRLKLVSQAIAGNLDLTTAIAIISEVV